MQVTDKVTLNLSGEELFAPIFARQGDLNSRIVEATLQFGEALYEIPENTKVVVTYRSANGKNDIHDGAVSGANTVTFPLIPLLLSAPGRARCDVELYNSGDMLGTGLLYVDVTPIAAKSGALEASPEYQTFVDAIADMTNKTADADEAINNANTAAEAANTAAQNASEKATAAQAAADAANTAKAGADAAAGRANTASEGADASAQAALDAAAKAEAAAEGAVSAMQVKYPPVVHQITESTTTLPVTIPGGITPTVDDLVSVYLNGHLLIEEQDYTRAADAQSITFTTPIPPAADGELVREVAIQTQKQVVTTGDSLTAEAMLAFMASKGQPDGLAGLGADGKLAQMPTAADVGAIPLIAEGQWEPTVVDMIAGTDGNTYSQRSGNYIVIGKLCFCRFDILISTRTTNSEWSASNAVVGIRGLPIIPHLSTGATDSAYSMTTLVSPKTGAEKKLYSTGLGYSSIIFNGTAALWCKDTGDGLYLKGAVAYPIA